VPRGPRRVSKEKIKKLKLHKSDSGLFSLFCSFFFCPEPKYKNTGGQKAVWEKLLEAKELGKGLEDRVEKRRKEKFAGMKIEKKSIFTTP
jgi:hypothetical protein